MLLKRMTVMKTATTEGTRPVAALAICSMILKHEPRDGGGAEGSA
jgi:hypothetical protein